MSSNHSPASLPSPVLQYTVSSYKAMHYNIIQCIVLYTAVQTTPTASHPSPVLQYTVTSYKAMHYSIIQCIELHTAVQTTLQQAPPSPVLQYTVMSYKAMHYNIIQCCTIQYSVVQSKTLQYNTVYTSQNNMIIYGRTIQLHTVTLSITIHKLCMNNCYILEFI